MNGSHVFGVKPIGCVNRPVDESGSDLHDLAFFEQSSNASLSPSRLFRRRGVNQACVLVQPLGLL